MKLVKFLMTLIILQLPTSSAFSQLLLHTRELCMKVRNGEKNGTITFFTQSEGSTVWDRQGLITTDQAFVNPDNLTIQLDQSGNFPFLSERWNTSEEEQDPPHLGRGYYTISVDVGNATLSVDCFGTTKLFGLDREITYDVSTDSFYDESNEIITSIDLFDDPICLQPSPPVNFICTNADHNGENPHFEWYWPTDPNRSNIDPEWPYDIKYKIYRKDGAYSYALVASGFNDLSWTDPEINIEPKSIGIQFTYYAKAYTDQAPDSDPSETAIIYGLYVQKSGPENSAYDCSDGATNGLPTIFNWDAYPNPFNPNTTIRYALPTGSYVTLKVFNLRGELVKTLVNGNRAANRYQVVWNGDNESGAKVAAGIYLY